ncbi:hypothetical protein EBT31_13815 [bacterium]|nr:hypothetical protein [bacterium]
MFGKSKHQIGSVTRQGRRCDGRTIIEQMGMMTFSAVCGRRALSLKDEKDNTVGIAMFVTSKRRIEVILNFLDTYTVRRIYADIDGNEFVEEQFDMVYADQLEQVVWQASVWE